MTGKDKIALVIERLEELQATFLSEGRNYVRPELWPSYERMIEDLNMYVNELRVQAAPPRSGQLALTW